MIVDAGYAELLVTHRPVKPRNRRELAEMTALLEKLAANEKKKAPAMEQFIEMLTALILQYEEEIEPDPERSPAGVLRYLMEERGLRQIDLVPIVGTKSYVSQILSGHRPISKDASRKLADFFKVSAYSFLRFLGSHGTTAARKAFFRSSRSEILVHQMVRNLIVVACLAGLATGQTRPEFEVASMKPSAGGAGSSISVGRSGNFEAKNLPLKSLIAEAYRVKTFEIYGGPGWIGSDSYDIIAKREVSPAPVETTREALEKLRADLQLRIQMLLEDRCSLKVHRERKELPVYALTVGKSGLKLQPPNCVEAGSSPPPVPGQPPLGHCDSTGVRRNGATSVMTGTGIAMSDLVRFLSTSTVRPVVDKTGYAQKFNAKLEWAPDGAPSSTDDAGKPVAPADVTAPSLFTALQEQLGLKLESTKGLVEVLVIDHVEKPTANEAQIIAAEQWSRGRLVHSET